jgi:cytochrome c biogenesis protein CcmG, thiol:disulfide interchange protein DsbE
MTNGDEHEPPGAERVPRGMAISVIAPIVAIAALIVLALVTRTDTSAVRDSDPAAPGTALPGELRARIEANRRQRRALLDGSVASRLAALKGVPVVVNQWASWCPPCRAEFPFFAAIAERYRNRVAFLGLNSRDERGAATAFLAQHPVGYPSIFDPRAEQARSIGAGTGWPTTVYFDADGKAVFIRQGGYTDAATLEADIHEHALGLPPRGRG